jgi:hypothetical protein
VERSWSQTFHLWRLDSLQWNHRSGYEARASTFGPFSSQLCGRRLDSLKPGRPGRSLYLYPSYNEFDTPYFCRRS